MTDETGKNDPPLTAAQKLAAFKKDYLTPKVPETGPVLDFNAWGKYVREIQAAKKERLDALSTR